MKRCLWKRVLTVSVLCLFVVVPMLCIGQEKSSPTAQAQKNKSVQQEKPSSGPQEGIKVHGHWSIVIKNPDGSVASRHEFENSLVNTGPDLLAELLARIASPGAWEINLLNTQAGGSACGGVGCFIIEPGIATGGSTNLTVTYVANPARTILQGSFQASAAGDIAQVQTIYFVCPSSVSPTACPGSLGAAGLFGVQPFTARALPAPITVQSGQIVQVSVTFTFS